MAEKNEQQEVLDLEGLTHLCGRLNVKIADAKKAGTDAQGSVTSHNTDTAAHNDLRLELAALAERINAALDSDDETLDELSEIVAYIKSNKELIEAITTSKVNVSDIINDLVTNVANKPLSAAQGVALKKLIDDLEAAIPNSYTHPSSHPASMITGLAAVATSGNYNDLSNKPTIPTGGTVDSALSSTSTNPVQNKVINSALAGKASTAAATASAAGLMSAADKSKLDGISSGANNYTHPTTSGNKHIPSGGTYGQFLKWSADGTATWSNDNNTRAARKVVGTSASGWTAKDCDYLCDGTADQEEINAALDALPSTGGEVILLDGIYNITAQVNVSKSYTTLRGAGQATKLVRAFDGDEILYLAGGHCTIEDINIDGKSGIYTSTDNRGVYFLTSNNLLKGLIVRNNAGYGICAAANYNKVIGCTVSASRIGIRVDGDNCIVSGNIVHENTQYGIDVNGNHNVVEGNVSRLNATANFYIMGSTYNTVCNNDFSVVSGDSVTPKAIYLAGTSNENNIITNNNLGDGAVSDAGGSGNVVGTAFDFMNRTNAVDEANTNYTTLMARGTSLNSAETTPAVNGAIAWTYE